VPVGALGGTDALTITPPLLGIFFQCLCGVRPAGWVRCAPAPPPNCSQPHQGSPDGSPQDSDGTGATTEAGCRCCLMRILGGRMRSSFGESDCGADERRVGGAEEASSGECRSTGDAGASGSCGYDGVSCFGERGDSVFCEEPLLPRAEMTT